eukprot:scaffold500458_cov33-Prasinocladus_malaysianus.AAC.1
MSHAKYDRIAWLASHDALRRSSRSVDANHWHHVSRSSISAHLCDDGALHGCDGGPPKGRGAVEPAVP